MSRATRAEIVDYLAGVPGAHSSWADVLYTAMIPLASLDVYVQKMAEDAGSPLRRAEDAELSKELVKLNGVFGDMSCGGKGNGKTLVKINAVMTMSEIARLNSLVSNFCQIEVVSSGRFGRNGHVVRNAVRRCVAGYQVTKIPSGSRVLEVGPDVKNWIVDSVQKPWEVGKGGSYVGSRPNISQRDVVRVQWESLARRVRNGDVDVYSELVRDRAGRLVMSYDTVFPCKKVQDLDVRADYIASNDSNYDIKFSDMPSIMVGCGARAWHGSMLRVKALTSRTRLRTGTLSLLGVSYRVDWDTGRIDFRDPTCPAFGYSHDVNELIKYEECNGFVWSTDRANYVYAKGAETNDEILFFSVVRVAKAIYMQQPGFVENPQAGMVRVNSIWAVGGYTDGVPCKFEPVQFEVDRLAFGKILEKRRAIDVKGDLAQTMTLVRSTAVRMWINGAPVGTSVRIQSALCEATAVAIEVLVSQMRSSSNLTFSSAMGQFKVCMDRGSWIYNMLSNLIDLRAVVGSVTGPITQKWGSVRGAIADAALSVISDVSVSFKVVEDHVRTGSTGLSTVLSGRPQLACGCLEAEECRCGPPDPDEWVTGNAPVQESSGSSTLGDGHESESEATSTLGNEWSEPDLSVADETTVVKGWRAEEHSEAVERRAMEESVAIKKYIQNAILTETRIDAGRLARACITSTDELLQHCTTRTQHTLVQFAAGVCVKKIGHDISGFMAMYEHASDKIFRVYTRGNVLRSDAPNGWYYTSNHLEVWNMEDLSAAVSYALDYGSVRAVRKEMDIVLGVPGAGKTYTMMERISKDYEATAVNFLVIAVTGKAADAARAEGRKRGMSEGVLNSRIRTLDSYLMNGKFPVDLICVDEFPMAHFGDIDAVISIAGAKKVRLYGDGRQCPWDPFTAEFDCQFSTIAGTVDLAKVTVLTKTHRLNKFACAAFLDCYPAIYPCDCHSTYEKDNRRMSYKKIGSVEDASVADNVRVHTYTRAELDKVADVHRFVGDRKAMKMWVDKGVTTVHSDQGSTHKNVLTVRARADYDKNAAKRNPSLYNRPNYVLTDMTRHTHGYDYESVSEENDLIRKRILLSNDLDRLKLVSEKKGMGLTSVADMLSNKYRLEL